MVKTSWEIGVRKSQKERCLLFQFIGCFNALDSIVSCFHRRRHQTSAQFNEGGAMGLLLYNLGVCRGCQVLFDSMEILGKYVSCSVEDNFTDVIDVSFARESVENMVINMSMKSEISDSGI